MILRSWGANTSPEGAEVYAAYFNRSLLPELAQLDGFVGAYLLRRDGNPVEVRVLTLWESLDAIRAFAGDELNTAVVEPEAEAALDNYDRSVVHYTVIAHNVEQ